MTVALMFPGQGSQSVGMGHGLHRAYSEVKETFEWASHRVGQDLAALCFKGPRQALNATEITQVAIFTLSLATYRVLSARGVVPDVVVGHSLGEITALTAIGCIDADRGLDLVQARSRLMRQVFSQTNGSYGMAAIEGMPTSDVETLVRQSSSPLWIANYNAPAQTVVSGEIAAIQQLSSFVQGSATKLIQLPVSGAFHTPLLSEAAIEFAQHVDAMEFEPPMITVIGNVDAAPISSVPQIKAELGKQMCSPVRWTATLNYLSSIPVEHYVEVAPGRVLKGLLMRNARGARCLTTDAVNDIEAVLRALGPK